MFPESDWTMLAKATLHGNVEAQQALERFYTSYRQPVMSFLRWKGVPSDALEDLTQDFFIDLINHSTLRRYDRARGKFRTYLSAALTNFLNLEVRKRLALKRGGGAEIVSLNEPGGASNEAVAGTTELDSDLLDRHLASELMSRALASARQQWLNAGKQDRYEVLRQFLPGSSAIPATAEAAHRLGLTAVAFRAELSRFRAAIRQALRNEIAAIVASAEEIDAEMSHFQTVLHRSPAIP